MYKLSQQLMHLASAAQFHIESFGYDVADRRHLPSSVNINQQNGPKKSILNQTCSCFIHVALVYSIGGSRKMNSFCIRISRTIGLTVICVSINQYLHPSDQIPYTTLNDLRKTLEQNTVDPFIKLSDPVVKICVAFQIQSVDLIHIRRLGTDAKERSK